MNLDDRMALYESRETSRRLMPLLPALARVDGRCFHAFTKDMHRPYDSLFHSLMVQTMTLLMRGTAARLGHTQSDEITLFWHSDDPKSQIYFDGRCFKMVSALAADASLHFNDGLSYFLREKMAYRPRPRFDARVWNVPTLEEAANVFLWRERDATRNSISMAARALYSHKALHGKNSSDMQEMMMEKGINWNDYPADCKRGTYCQRRVISTPFAAAEREKLPPKHEARTNPDLRVERHEVSVIEMPSFGTVTNRVAVLLGAKPETGLTDAEAQTRPLRDAAQGGGEG